MSIWQKLFSPRSLNKKTGRAFFILALLLFVSFFPQIVEGPICRYGQTTEQLWNGEGIRYENLTWGIPPIGFWPMCVFPAALRRCWPAVLWQLPAS